MKKLAYYAAAGLTMLSATVFAEDVELEFYGKAHVSAGYLNDGNNGGLNASSNSSRVGVKADYTIREGLELIAQVERGVDLTDGDSTFKARSSYLGLRGEWGTVRVGYYTSPTMALLSKVEEFRDRAGEGRNIVRQGAANLDRRLKSSVHYQSPNWQGLTFAVQYGTTETSGASATTMMSSTPA